MRHNHQSLLRTINSSKDRPLVTLHVVRSYAVAAPQQRPQTREELQQASALEAAMEGAEAAARAEQVGTGIPSTSMQPF